MIQQILFATTYHSSSNNFNGVTGSNSSDSISNTLNSLEPAGIIVLIGFTIAIVLFVLTITFYVRWWFAQSAIFDIREQLSEIIEILRDDKSNPAFKEIENGAQTSSDNINIEDVKGTITWSRTMGNLKESFINLKNPSKSLIVLLIAAFVIFSILMLIIFFFIK